MVLYGGFQKVILNSYLKLLPIHVIVQLTDFNTVWHNLNLPMHDALQKANFDAVHEKSR